MIPEIPRIRLENYGISPTRGFLPEDNPLTILPDPYYNKWEFIVRNLQGLTLSHRLRGVVNKLPVLMTDGLSSIAEYQRAYCLLTFMLHAYVWGGDEPADRIPQAISIPLLEVSEFLELPPVATYAAVCLWNFKPLFVDEDVDNLENLATLQTFTGSMDESWFYLVSVAIEARGAPTIQLMLDAFEAAIWGEESTVTACLQTFAERLTDLTTLLKRMHERCDPRVFYNRIRVFLAGSKNMAEAGLPNGVLYEDGSGQEEYRQYSGGSNAQSSLIQFFDLALGVEHYPTGQNKDSTSRNNFLRDMRKYMPGPHTRFLEDVSAVANIRQFVETNRHNRDLCLAYDACLSMLSAFRDTHIAIVTRYVITPSREVRARSRSPKRVNLASKKASENRSNQKGTGGTALIPFLKQARDETGSPAVEDWARRFMKRKVRTEGEGDFFMGKEEDVEVKGLAGTWTMGEEVGGICLC